MADLPTGVVTFVFTDVEGSTRLLQELGSEYRTLLERHSEIVRNVTVACGGVVVSTEGDSFFIVFTSPLEALRAISDFQTQLAAETWTSNEPVALRVGVHTGEATLGGDNYWGIDVHRTARIAAIGHGGQVLVSSVTAALAQPHLPPTLSLRSLGVHRFKDLGEGEEIFQLLVDGLRSDYPPLTSLASASHNLPVQLTSYIPRAELAMVTDLLRRARLVTLTGPGGTGKTRLSLQVGAEEISRQPDGVWFVQLAAITDPELVTSAVASTLSLQLPEEGADERLSQHLASKEMLLILDNFEQVLGAASRVATWLQGAPHLKVLVSSRSPLKISGEHDFAVPPLALPMPGRPVAGYEAVALFVERAQAARPGFVIDEENATTVAQIVKRLEGLPLAIELAAARLRLLSLEAIRDRLDSRLGLLTGGARDLPERQQTLRKAIEWSFDLLEPNHQKLFTQLGVFVGGFALDEASAVVEGEMAGELLDGLEALVDQSLLKPIVDAATPRFLMLETIREFAIERLDASSGSAEIRDRHVRAFLALVENASQHFTTDDQRRWLDRISEDQDNIRSALNLAIEQGDAKTAQLLAGSLWRYWQMRGFLSEGRERTAAALALGRGDAKGRLKALDGAGGLAYWQADGAAAQRYYSEQLDLAREIGDQKETGYALFNLSSAESILNRDNAYATIEEAVRIAEEVGDPLLLGSVYWGLGSNHFLGTGPDEPNRKEHLQEAIAAFIHASEYLQGLGSSYQIGWTHNMLAFCYLADSRPDEAIVHLRDGLKRFVVAGDLSALPLQVAAFAEFALQKGDVGLGLTLAGASGALQTPSDTRLLDVAINEVRGVRATIAEIGSERAEVLLAKGAALNQEEIVEIVSGL